MQSNTKLANEAIQCKVYEICTAEMCHISASLGRRRRAQQLQGSSLNHTIARLACPAQTLSYTHQWNQISRGQAVPGALGVSVVVEHVYGKAVEEGVWRQLGCEAEPAACYVVNNSGQPVTHRAF